MCDNLMIVFALPVLCFVHLVCALECQSGYYGINCINRCSANCDVPQSCDKTSGQCYRGCQPGWRGNTCDQECLPGSYGYNCINRCSEHCSVSFSCDRVTGKCNDGCKSGWAGDTCHVCDYGYFGAECNRKCGHCLQTDHCNHVNGSCLNGCLHGYKGDYCNETCPPGFFGLDCINRCDSYCSGNESCDPVLGICAKGCTRGWSGRICGLDAFQMCDNGYFGAECNRKCGHCLQTDHCNHVNGSCLNGCLHGYKGDYCNETCPPGFFGLDCINRCDSYCSGNESCDPVLGICTEGCKRGWSGLICGLDRLNCQSYGDNMPIVVGVVVSVVIIFGGIIIHVILWRRKTGTTLQIPSDGQSGPSETSQHYTQLDIINKSSNYDEIHSHSNYLNL